MPSHKPQSGIWNLESTDLDLWVLSRKPQSAGRGKAFGEGAVKGRAGTLAQVTPNPWHRMKGQFRTLHRVARPADGIDGLGDSSFARGGAIQNSFRAARRDR